MPRFAATMCVIAIVTGSAVADDDASLLPTTVPTMDRVLVTATGGELPQFDTPYSTEQIDQTQRFERAYRTLPQVLRDVPGVLLQETSAGQGSPFIRGFTAQRNLLLIDGVRLNNSVLRSGPNQYWATVDVLGAERVEVVKGPASVLYGTDAIGGTVQVITRSPYGFGEGTNVSGRAVFRTSTAERSFQQRGEVSVTQDQTFGFLGGVTGKFFNDVMTGNGVQENVGYDEYDADFKAEFWVSDNARVVALHQRVRQNNVPRTHSTVYADSFAGSTVGGDRKRDLDQERELTYIQYHAEGLDGPIEELHASLSYQRQSEVQDRVRGSLARRVTGIDVETLGMFLRAVSPSPIGRLTYGIEFYHDDVNSFSNTNPVQGPVADDATYDLLGAFVQSEIELAERLTVILGARITYARVDAERVDDITTPIVTDFISVSDEYFAAVGNVRVLYELVPDELNLFGGVSQGFRAPNLSDLTGNLSSSTSDIEIVSPGLDPETYVNFELGLKGRNDNAAFELTGYYMLIDDQILRTPTGVILPGPVTELTRSNSGEGWVYGIEFAGSHRLGGGFTLFGNVAFMEGKVETFPAVGAPPRDEWLDRLMPLTGQVGVRWDEPQSELWGELLIRMADDATRLSSRDMRDTQRIPPGGTPSYVVVDLIGGGKIDQNITWRAGLENVFDENYRVHGSGSNMPGIAFVFGVEIFVN